MLSTQYIFNLACTVEYSTYLSGWSGGVCRRSLRRKRKYISKVTGSKAHLPRLMQYNQISGGRIHVLHCSKVRHVRIERSAHLLSPVWFTATDLTSHRLELVLSLPAVEAVFKDATSATETVVSLPCQGR